MKQKITGLNETEMSWSGHSGMECLTVIWSDEEFKSQLENMQKFQRFMTDILREQERERICKDGRAIPIEQTAETMYKGMQCLQKHCVDNCFQLSNTQ